MKITICGSMSFAKEMIEYKEKLEELKHIIFVPSMLEDFISGNINKKDEMENAARKIKYNLIIDHFNEIQKADAILVLNFDKHEIQNYIGANSFLEIGYAFSLSKKIYLLNDIPDMKYILAETIAMQPIIINNNLTKIK